MRWARAAAVGGIVTSATTAARALEPPALPLELAWEAPAGCPDAAFVAARVEAILRGPPEAPVAVVARGTVERAGAAYHLALTLRTGDLEETRAIDAASCAALAEAAAVVVALAIDPSRDEASPAPAPAPAPTPAPAPVAAPPPRTARPKPKRSPSSPSPVSRLALGVGGALGLGSLPEASGAVLVSGTLRHDRVRVGLLGSVTMPVSATFDRTAGATFHQLEVGAFGSYLVPIGARVSVGPAANLELSHVRVRGFGIRAPKLTTTFWPTAVVGARLEVRIASRLGLFSRAEGLFPFAAPAFSLATAEGGVRLHEPALPSLRLSLGLEIVLP